MRTYSQSIGLAFAVACSVCLTDFAFAQSRSFSSGKTLGFGRVSGSQGQDDGNGYYGRSPRSASQTKSTTSASRSISFTKDGKRVSISENASGITVSVDGKRVRAKDAAELKKRYPDAYRLYDEKLAKSNISAFGSARGSASSGGGGGAGTPGQFNRSTNASENRSVSVTDNGRKVSITQNKTGITVTMNGKRVRAKNAAELKKKFPDAFKMYEKHMGGADNQQATGGVAAAGGGNGPSDATILLREELTKMRDEHADQPQLKSLIEKMLRNVPQ